jgi:hypothetical protein
VGKRASDPRIRLFRQKMDCRVKPDNGLDQFDPDSRRPHQRTKQAEAR